MYQLLGSILCLSSKHFPGFVPTFCCGELKSRQLDELETENSANILELLQSTFLVKTRGGGEHQSANPTAKRNASERGLIQRELLILAESRGNCLPEIEPI